MKLSGLTVGIPREIMPREARVAALPETVRNLGKEGARVLVEQGAGRGGLDGLRPKEGGDDAHLRAADAEQVEKGEAGGAGVDNGLQVGASAGDQSADPQLSHDNSPPHPLQTDKEVVKKCRRAGPQFPAIPEALLGVGLKAFQCA